MNLILLYEHDFINGADTVVLDGRRHEHIRDVHRASVGDTLCVGVENGNVGQGKITRMEDTCIEMTVVLDTPAPPSLNLNLILALPRPKVVSRVIHSVTTLGVKNIWLINANRVEKSYWKSPRVSDNNLSKQITLGLEQAKDTILPTIIKKQLFKPFVEDELPDIIKGTTPIVAHPGSSSPCPREIHTPVTLAIGPEGGFIPYEVNKLVECGFIPIHFGERILRVETAVPALIGRIF